MDMDLNEIVSFLSSALYEQEREFEYFSDRINDRLLENENPSSDDLFKLGTFLENGGGAFDEVGYSLVRLAALDGHTEALQWYEDHVGEKLVPNVSV